MYSRLCLVSANQTDLHRITPQCNLRFRSLPDRQFTRDRHSLQRITQVLDSIVFLVVRGKFNVERMRIIIQDQF